MENPTPEKPPKSFKVLIIMGILAVVLVAGVAVVWYVFLAPQSSEESSVVGKIKNLWASEKKSSSTGQGHIYKMEPFLVNLMDPAQLRYLKITLHVESNQEKPNEEYEKRLPQLRDAILIILSSKNYKDIMDSEGKTSLREEIKTKMNQLLVDLKVQNIYFTEFVVQ
ncbi:MAG: flagellar basal body-associated FliL family protein [Thermodesulfobacteriota bacterium]